MSLFRIICIICLQLTAALAHAGPADLSYSGRITDGHGRPVEGPVTLSITFHPLATGGAVLIPASLEFSSVELKDGVFTVALGLTTADERALFLDNTGEVWIQVKDETHGKTYERQRFSAVPFALSATQASTAGSAERLRDKEVLGTLDGTTAGQVLKWNGTAFHLANDLAGGGGLNPGDVDSSLIADGTITNEDVASNAELDATKIHDGSVDNLEFGHLNGVTSALQDQLDAKADEAATTAALAGKADLAHTHAEADVTGLTADLAGLAADLTTKADAAATTAALASKADATHTHAQGDVTGLAASLAGKAEVTHAHSSLDASDGAPVAALQVDAEGFVGIGTSSPNEILEVVADTPVVYLRSAEPNGSAVLRLGEASTVAAVDLRYDGENDQVSFMDRQTAVPILTVRRAGLVGIGSSDPQQILDVAGSVKVGTSGTCDATKAGSIRWNGTTFQGCDGSSWISLAGPTCETRTCSGSGCTATCSAGYVTTGFQCYLNSTDISYRCSGISSTSATAAGAADRVTLRCCK